MSAFVNYWRKVWAIVSKDITAERRTREIISAMLVFSVLTTLVFSFALDMRGKMAQAAAPGLLWVAIIFAGTLGLNRSLAQEKQTGCIDGLRLAPVDRSAIFFGKALGNLIFITIVELVLLPFFAILFDAPLLQASVLFWS